jgi:hypothetical protein
MTVGQPVIKNIHTGLVLVHLFTSLALTFNWVILDSTLCQGRLQELFKAVI